MFKAVIFDLNGLFVKSREFLSARIARDFGVDEKAFLAVLDQLLEKTRLPENTDSWLLWEPELQKLGLKFTKAEWWDYWFRYESEDISMLNLARELKADGTQVYILSNNFIERAKFYRDNFSFPFLKEVVDKIYFSFETGFIKPNPEAWLHILRENHLKPEECVYFDNSMKNVSIAEKLGIKSYLFESAKKSKAILQELRI